MSPQMPMMPTKQRRKAHRFFTLFEIVLCVAILGLLGTLLGWQLKTMVDSQHFQKNIDMLWTDLHKMQILALANRADLELRITEKGGKYAYTITSDEPLKSLDGKTVKLLGVKKITGPRTLIVYSSGRMEPLKPITLTQANGGGITITPGTTISLEKIHPSVE